MKSTTKWVKNFQSVTDNGRNHGIVIDLPEAKNGDNLGPTALELTLMGFSGCIGTIFCVVAQKRRLSFSSLEVICTGEQKDGAKTISDVSFELKIKTDKTEEDVKKCLHGTMENCPVGLLFENAGVNVDYTIEML